MDALRAFVIAVETEDGPVTNEQAGKIIDMAAATVVVCNPFLTDVGLIIRKESGKFDVSEEARAFKQAYEWNTETAGHKLSRAFSDKWFAKALLPRLKMRDWGKEEALQILAEAAGASKEYQLNLWMLIEFMAVAGMLEIEGNFIKKASSLSEPPSPVHQSSPKEDAMSSPKLDGDICFLNKDRTRFVKVDAPLDITPKEIERFKKWLNINYFVDEEGGSDE